MRLDTFLSNAGIGSRSQVKNIIKKGQISVNGRTAGSGDESVNEDADVILYAGTRILLQKYRYFMLNKPKGVVSATEDNLDKTVLDCLSKEDAKDLFPVGRLDKDTTGLMLLTNDGELSHNLLSPRKHVDKTYYVICEKDVTEEQLEALRKGVEIGDDKPTLPALARPGDSAKEIYLTIREGRFHQVKRMLMAVGNKVCELERVSMGSLKLDKSLAPGEYRALTAEELQNLKNCMGKQIPV
ncbi:MAG: rRNA pseudouridine synthase [Lachnospiraceae bacterium]|nr:rRNA pseudouridine synthase [Lachnospiraceae bacterium]